MVAARSEEKKAKAADPPDGSTADIAGALSSASGEST
jgi:hypothetical protein